MIFPPLASLLSLHLFHFKNCDLIHSSLFLHLSIFKKSRENNVGNDSTLARENLHVKTKNDTFVRRERFPLPLLSCATAILIIAHGHILYPKKKTEKSLATKSIHILIISIFVTEVFLNILEPVKCV